MWLAPSSIRAVVLLIFSSLCGTMAFPQGINFIRHMADPVPPANMPAGRASCAFATENAAASYKASVVAGDAALPCDTPAVNAPPMNPCHSAKPAQIGCDSPRDLVQKDLAAMGKTGQKILRARDRVLEILQTENACSEWLRQKDSDPALTFQTLTYAVDRHGEEIVHAWRDTAVQYTYRDPYVATVGQATGAYATITLNADGAFFQLQAPMLLVAKEGGPPRNAGMRSLNIGPYSGDSLTAQTLALLHEFGHVINLLPFDFDNEDGKSMQNTAEVLRYCRAEIDSKGRRGALQAAK
jgi:hypothetical protein